MKIYTKTGDKGMTSLFGGQRVSKADGRLAVYGKLDELNAWLGLIQAHLQSESVFTELNNHLQAIQNDLFVISSHLATPYASAELVPTHLPSLPTNRIQILEQQIDTMSSTLPELRNFILPGGSVPGSELHIARAVCREAERTCIALQTNAFVSPMILQYLNRLSDWLFTAARWVNHQSNASEIIWHNN